jgi:hypothetical protein
MGQPEKHVAQWRHNREFLGSIDARFPDWKVTAAFYVALHAIDALLESDGVVVTSHDSRKHTLKNTNRYAQIWKHYAPLYALARTVRYLAEPGHWVGNDRIGTEVFGKLLYPVEKSVAKINPKLGIEATAVGPVG